MKVLALLGAFLPTFHASDVIFGENGVVDISKTIDAALNGVNAVNPLWPPGYTSSEPVEVESQLRLNKLVSFDEETTETTYDFFFRLYWTDSRFNNTALYAALPEWISEGGLELRDLCVNPYDEPGGCAFWVPHMLTFLGATEDVIVHTSTIRVKPGGAMYWSRHMTLTVAQPELDQEQVMFPYESLPMLIQYESYGFDSYSMKLLVRPPDMTGFKNHPEWIMGDKNSKASANCQQNQEIYVNTAVRYLDQIKCSFVFTRGAAASIVARVIYPMAVISMLSVFTLWMSLDDRINAVLALFATASAFYYVASDNLPTMHLWTNVDIYFTCVFTLMLVLAIGHAFVLRLTKTANPTPNRTLMGYLLQTCLEVTMPALSSVAFIVFAMQHWTASTISFSVILVLVCVTSGAYSLDRGIHRINKHRGETYIKSRVLESSWFTNKSSKNCRKQHLYYDETAEGGIELRSESPSLFFGSFAHSNRMLDDIDKTHVPPPEEAPSKSGEWSTFLSSANLLEYQNSFENSGVKIQQLLSLCAPKVSHSTASQDITSLLPVLQQIGIENLGDRIALAHALRKLRN